VWQWQPGCQWSRAGGSAGGFGGPSHAAHTASRSATISSTHRQLAFSALLLAVTAVWGWTFVVVKDAVAHYGVVSFLAIRFALAAVSLAPFAARRANRRTWAVGIAIGLVLAIAYLFQTFGIRYTTATNSGLITGLFVVFAPICNRLLFGVRTPRALWAAVLASIVGLALLTGAGADRLAFGDVLTLGCAVCFGLHVALLDRHARRHDAAGLALGQLACAAVVFLVVWPFGDPFELPTAPVWGALILTGVVASAVGFYSQTAAQRELPAIRAAMILTMEPAFAALFGRFLAGDRLAPLQVLGGVLMVGALVAANIRPTADSPA
jgi:drug/metabolite transporter (DMT)-like permease